MGSNTQPVKGVMYFVALEKRCRVPDYYIDMGWMERWERFPCKRRLYDYRVGCVDIVQ